MAAIDFPSDASADAAMARRADTVREQIRVLTALIDRAPIAAADWDDVGTMGAIADDLADLLDGTEAIWR